MIVTEEEAKTKRCQETFTLVPDENLDRKIEWHNCIGSACMAWRWYRRPPSSEDGDSGHNQRFSVMRGYCGKAGRP